MLGDNSGIGREISIGRLADRQHGNLTRRQLLELGFNDDAIAHRVKAGRLHRVHPGVYAVGRPPKTALERAAAAVLACGPQAALSHMGALALWGFVTRWPAHFDVTVPRDRRPTGITVHRTRALQRRDVRTHLGIRVTSPARTVLDCAPQLTDRGLARTVNDARLSGYLHVDALADVLRRFPHHPGVRRLTPFVTIPTGPTRSELEDAFLAFCERFDLPRPLVNTPVAGHLVDALFVTERLIVELDSYGFHRSRDAFERDRDRDADTLLSGHGTVRITSDRMTNTPRQEAARLRAILPSAGRRGARDAPALTPVSRASGPPARSGLRSSRRGSTATPAEPGARRRARHRPAR